MHQLTLTTKSSEETVKLGRMLGENLDGGEIIELASDLGSGKTTLVKGIAVGAGSRELVSSPSFTICNEYACSKFKIYHFDFYRLSDPGIVRRELEEVIGSRSSVIIIEWPEVVTNVLPNEHIVIQIKSPGVNSRRLTIKYTKDLKYITKGLK
jgi:tRNA threonylcarbamoyladenosine biosynthesis protein TsaE